MRTSRDGAPEQQPTDKWGSLRIYGGPLKGSCTTLSSNGVGSYPAHSDLDPETMALVVYVKADCYGQCKAVEIISLGANTAIQYPDPSPVIGPCMQCACLYR